MRVDKVLVHRSEETCHFFTFFTRVQFEIVSCVSDMQDFLNKIEKLMYSTYAAKFKIDLCSV